MLDFSTSVVNFSSVGVLIGIVADFSYLVISSPSP